MIKVITYGTFDLLHYGHIRLLEKAKQLGDYLIVAVTADDFDKRRGKINVKQTLVERIESVRSIGIADEIIIEEYEGQKIDDIKRLGVDIFTVGSDWEGKFDYLKEYCEVVYLPRTEGVSSSELRAAKGTIHLGIIGDNRVLLKLKNECSYVNGIQVTALCSTQKELLVEAKRGGIAVTTTYEELLHQVDAVYVASEPTKHYEHIKQALLQKKHVMCESPLAVCEAELDELICLADQQKLVLMEAIKTAYSTAYYRLLLLAESGRIGSIVAVDATCTSLSEISAINQGQSLETWNSICGWGPTTMLPIFQLLGTDYRKAEIISAFAENTEGFDVFTKIDFLYPHATATLKVGKGVKSEGELIVSGSKGYIYVPAPWWKTDYFEIRYEDQSRNQRYFYQLDGEGIRYEIVNFAKSIEKGVSDFYIGRDVSRGIVRIIERFYKKDGLEEIKIGSSVSQGEFVGG